MNGEAALSAAAQPTSPQVSAPQLAASGGLGVDWGTLGIVLLGVAVLMVLIRLVGLWAERAHVPAKPAAPKSPAGGASPVAAGASSGEFEPELIAVLTAAATTVLGRGVRLLGVREVAAANTRDQQAWSREGRREIYISHRIR